MAIRRRRILPVVYTILATLALSALDQPTVRVAPTDAVGPRTLETQTKDAIVRDYLAAWQALSGALAENNASLLDANFVGDARQRLRDTIRDQQKLDLRVEYNDRKHDISVVFYSPDGLSIQLVDKAEYDLELFDHDKLQATKHMQTPYLAVLTPTEVRWKVRIFQAAQ